MSTKLLIADDNLAMRKWLKSLLAEQTDLEVVGEAEDGQCAVKLAKELLPNVVLMDLTMPKMNGVEATRNILRQNPATRIIIVSTHSHKYFVGDARKAGVSGYVLKSRLLDDLIRAVHAVMSNEFFLSPVITGINIADYIKRPTEPDESAS